MKIISLGILLIATSVKCQENDLSLKNQTSGSHVKIVHTNGKASRGYAYSLTDDSIKIFMPAGQSIHSNMQMDGLSGSFKTVPATDIQKINFREKKQFKTNVIAGFLIGTITGIIVGHIKQNGIAIDINENTTLDFTHPPEKTNYPKIILSGAAIGTATGIITGSISKTFILKGKNERFRENEVKMSKYMYTNNPVHIY